MRNKLSFSDKTGRTVVTGASQISKVQRPYFNSVDKEENTAAPLYSFKTSTSRGKNQKILIKSS